MNTRTTHQDMRKGSVSPLKMVIMRLSFVTASIFGPGNWPFIRIPCIQEQTQDNENDKRIQTRTKKQELKIFKRRVPAASLPKAR